MHSRTEPALFACNVGVWLVPIAKMNTTHSGVAKIELACNLNGVQVHAKLSAIVPHF